MMHTIPIHTLTTPRLILRKLELSDAPLFYQRIGGSQTVTQHMLWNPHTNLEESVASIQKVLQRYDTERCYRWAITLQEDNHLIGIIDLLSFAEDKSTCSFAYMLGEDFWNQGYGTEAVKAVFRFAFEQLDVSEIVADHFAENPASGAVMRKAGMRPCGTVSGKYEKNGILHDAVCYRITREDWNTP